MKNYLHKVVKKSYIGDRWGGCNRVSVQTQMLSKRDKLYVLPWEERKFKNHRNKVTCALPAIDDASPPQRPHVAVKLKKNQKEEDRKAKIMKDNFCLLQRLATIMKANRLDNHWKKPQPDFHHKVGLYFPVDSLKTKLQSAESATDDENSLLSCRRVKCFACEMKKISKQREALHIPTLETDRADAAPPLYPPPASVHHSSTK